MVQQAMHDADMPWVCCTALQLNKMQDSVDVHPFEWGSDATHLQGPYDIIICSDLTYDVSSAPQLLASLQALSDESTIILMSFEIRPGLDKFLGSYLPDCTCFRPARVGCSCMEGSYSSIIASMLSCCFQNKSTCLASSVPHHHL